MLWQSGLKPTAVQATLVADASTAPTMVEDCNVQANQSTTSQTPLPDLDFDGGEVEVMKMITDCFARYDYMAEGRHPHSEDKPEPLPEIGVHAEEDNVLDECHFAELMAQSTRPLYNGYTTSQLVTILLVLNCFVLFGVSNSFALEMLKLIHEILPLGNTLPISFYEANKSLKQMGLNFMSFHACKNGCCLFRKELSNVEKCPKCDEPRYVPHPKTYPVKVLHHFPIIPCLRRMFQYRRLTKLAKWHNTREKVGGNVEFIPNCKAWSHVDLLYPNFGGEGRNIRFGMALDGGNPYSNQSLSHSTWPILLLNYNLPPWLVTKRFFLMLALIIPRKESVTADNSSTT